GVRGVTCARKPGTTIGAKVSDHRPDLVNRVFQVHAPHRLGVADITYVRTTSGFCYTAFVTDAFSRKNVDWSTRTTMRTDALPLEALEAVALALNNRPRKVLGFRTPAEVFADQLQSIQNSSVATTDWTYPVCQHSPHRAAGQGWSDGLGGRCWRCLRQCLS